MRGDNFVNGFRLPAFAKINLYLRVLGRRPSDGLHEVHTLLQTISLCDYLTFDLRDEGFELGFGSNSDAVDVPLDETNLITRAARLLTEKYAVRSGARVTLEKHIPIQAGLGGGSSNAAIALLGLARLWDLKVSDAELTALAATLGADVPFFFSGGTGLGTGTGATITALSDAPAKSVLVVMPDARVSTIEAYRRLAMPFLTKKTSVAILSGSHTESTIKQVFDNVLRNDFEPVVFEMHQSIAHAKRMLYEHGATHALLSGSGASVFGIFDDTQALDKAYNALSRESGWRCFACHTLNRSAYHQALNIGS